MRLLPAVVGLSALALGLTACGQGQPSSVGTTLTMPARPSSGPGAADAPAAQEIPGSGAGNTGASGDPSGYCVIVAGGLTTAMLAPLSLRSTSDPEDLVTLEEQFLVLRDRVPAELYDDFTGLASSVEAPPAGSGTFDEAAFRSAMVPVEDWLGRYCDRS